MKGNKSTGKISGTVLRFVMKVGVPPYYQAKAHIVLNAADEQDQDWENFAVIEDHLRAAEKALEVAKQTYASDASDQEQLEQLGKIIREGWATLREREAAFFGSDGEED